MVNHPNRAKKSQDAMPQQLKVAVTQELIDKAKANGWTGARLIAEAVKQSNPGLTDVSVDFETSRYDEATGVDEYSPKTKRLRERKGFNPGRNN
jgi:hypothetical protein